MRHSWYSAGCTLWPGIIIKNFLSKGSEMLVETHELLLSILEFLKNGLGFLLLLIFMYLTAPGLSCGMWDLVPCPGIKPEFPALGVQSLSHWTTREVPQIPFYSACWEWVGDEVPLFPTWPPFFSPKLSCPLSKARGLWNVATCSDSGLSG